VVSDVRVLCLLSCVRAKGRERCEWTDVSARRRQNERGREASQFLNSLLQQQRIEAAELSAEIGVHVR